MILEMLRRSLKKAAYASGFLASAGFLLVLLVLLIGGLPQGRAPEPTPPPTFDAIEVEDVSVIHHAGRVDAVARLRNPNPRAGVPVFPVTFVILDAEGKEIASRRETTYVLPGSVQYIMALNIEVSDRVERARLDVPANPQFVAVPSSLTLPSFNTTLLERTERPSGATTLVQQKGLVTNTSTFPFQRVEVRAVALDAAENIVGVGTTFLGELKINERREFTVQWPLAATPAVRVIAIPLTNMFAEDNILRVIGDPGAVR
jgi:hypothetical protein